MYDKSRFAALVRGRRAELRMSQSDLANAIGVSVDAISKYESDKGYNPGVDKLVAIAEVLDCTPNYLLGWDK